MEFRQARRAFWVSDELGGLEESEYGQVFDCSSMRGL